MGIHKMLGISRREPLIATEDDIQKFDENLQEWRCRISALLAEYRQLDVIIGEDRHTMQRHLLILEREMLKGQINLAWQMYRVVQQDARTIKNAYFEENSPHRETKGRRRSV